jgi:uncharacterized protein YegL
MKLESTSRRLPIYLVVDTSASMAGPAIEAVNNGLQEFAAMLRNDPHAIEAAHVSVITFSSKAQQLVPLTETMAFQAPKLAANGGTALGAALAMLGSAFDTELHEKSSEHPGDWKPLVFILTDGEPNDEWREPARRLRERDRLKTANIIAIGCGPDVNTAILTEVVGDKRNVVLMPEMTPEYLRNCMKWISQSVKLASKSASQGVATMESSFETPPEPRGLRFQQ